MLTASVSLGRGGDFLEHASRTETNVPERLSCRLRASRVDTVVSGKHELRMPFGCQLLCSVLGKLEIHMDGNGINRELIPIGGPKAEN